MVPHISLFDYFFWSQVVIEIRKMVAISDGILILRIEVSGLKKYIAYDPASSLAKGYDPLLSSLPLAD